MKNIFKIILILFVIIITSSCTYYLTKDNCETIDDKIIDTIKYMEENNIKIYGVNTCGWCKKQIEEFGEFKDELISKGLYIDCLTNLNEGCNDVTSTPTWKKNDKFVISGYIPLNDIINNFN